MLLRITNEPVLETSPGGPLPAGLVGSLPTAGGVPLPGLAGVVLLAGSVRANALRRASGRLLLELPVEAGRSVMDIWHEQLTAAAVRFGVARLPVRVIVDKTTPLPANNPWNGRCDTRFEQDPFEYRGTGGLLRDLADQYGPDDRLIIANAAQILFEPLYEVAEALSQLDADVSIACRSDGSPTGVMLVRCGALGSLPKIGFIDLNEQALPTIARDHDVRVLRGPRQSGLPIRTLNDYLDALRQYHRVAQGRPTLLDPYAEDWQASFEVIEPGAVVNPSAVIHDSVVLEGATVEAGAVVVRSLVAPGAVVEEGRTVVEQIVHGPMLANGSESN